MRLVRARECGVACAVSKIEIMGEVEGRRVEGKVGSEGEEEVLRRKEDEGRLGDNRGGTLI